jgi:hypothetical protein
MFKQSGEKHLARERIYSTSIELGNVESAASISIDLFFLLMTIIVAPSVIQYHAVLETNLKQSV